MRAYPWPQLIRNIDDIRNEFAKISQCSYDERDSIIAKAYTLPTFTVNRTLVIPTTDAAASLSTNNQAFPQLAQGLTNYPILRVHNAANSTTTGGFSKIAFDTVDFDTASWWDATNHRYTPQQAGYYRVNLTAGGQVGTGGLTALTGLAVGIFLNGAEYARVHWSDALAGGGGTELISCNDIVHCNGSTDFIEGDMAMTGSGTIAMWGGTSHVYMSIELVAPPLESAPPNYLTSATLNGSLAPIDSAQVIAAFTVFASWLADVQRGNIQKNQ